MQSSRKHKYVLYGLIAMPLIFAIVIPLFSYLPMVDAGMSPGELPPFVPPGNPSQEVIAESMANMIQIMFMFIPATIPSIIASYTIVGEKINKQLEPLLATPTSDLELLLGKGLGAFLPAMGAAYVSFVGLVTVIDIISLNSLNFLPLPNFLSLVVVLLYSPLACILSTSWSVFISSKVSDIRAATQLGPIGAIPVFGFFFLFIGGLISTDWKILLLFTVVLSSLAAGFFYLSSITFRREAILTE